LGHPTIANPFDIAQLKFEIDSFNCQAYEKDGIKLTTHVFMGNVVEYFNKWWWIGELGVPIFNRDGKTWMSLTPMEIQSQWLPICRAVGRVGIGGLGLGYAALRCAQKLEVDEVVVYETDERTIKYFNESYKDRFGFWKVKIVNEDVREMKGEEFDYFFNDIYLTMLPDEVTEDMSLLTGNNSLKVYDFWGQEKVILQGYIDELDPMLFDDERWFIHLWQKQERELSRGQTSRISDMYDGIPSYYGGGDFIEETLEVMGRL
jgi:hypothetical protein